MHRLRCVYHFFKPLDNIVFSFIFDCPKCTQKYRKLNPLNIQSLRVLLSDFKLQAPCILVSLAQQCFLSAHLFCFFLFAPSFNKAAEKNRRKMNPKNYTEQKTVGIVTAMSLSLHRYRSTWVSISANQGKYYQLYA